MNCKAEIVVPITVAKNVVSINFNREVLVSLDCFGCKWSKRTVVLFEDKNESFCTPTRHHFQGRIVKVEVSDRKRLGRLSSKSVVIATYNIEYEFKDFTDSKYPERKIGPLPTWSRVTFFLFCTCGEEIENETQTNIVRPWRSVCKCGKDLHYEM